MAAAPTAATQAVPLSKKSDEYTRIKYSLQLSLRSNDVEDVRVWKVENPHLAVQFEKRTAGMLVLDSWVDATALDEDNNVQAVFSRGFKFPPTGQGMAFTHGNVKLNAANSGAHQLLYCQLGVGRSFVMDDPSAKKVLPPGYDSIYLQRDLDRDGDGKFSLEEYEAAATHDQRGPEEYSHEYMLLDPTQARACYLVEFFFTPGSAARRAQEAAGLASSEDSEAMYDRFDFFDPILYQPVSFRDKMVGSHSQGEPATHKLIAIGDAHDTAKAASEKEDPVLAQRQQEINAQLKRVDKKLREVNKNSAAVEESIYQLLQEALFQLQDETQRKMNTLLGEELELRRQQEQILWAETFLAQQRDTCSAPEFLEGWKNHLQLRDTLHASASTMPSVLDSVQADLRLDGAVHVTAASAAAAAAQQRALPPVQQQQQQQPQLVAAPVSSPAAPYSAAQPPVAPSPALPPPPAQAPVPAVVPGQSPAAPSTTASVATSASPAAPAEPADVASRFAQYSLEAQAQRRMRQLGVQPNPQQYFRDSQIISGDSATNLYFCLPFASNIPETVLLYASWHHAPDVPTLLQQCVETYAPSVLLIRSGDYVFGGYATDSWRADGQRFGSPKCFLFSITHDRKIPFHGRTRDAQSQTQPQVDEQGYPLPLQLDCLQGTPDSIQFGIHDLVLSGDFSKCSSALEGSYGFGLAQGSPEATTFLAGGQQFRADAVEVWQVQ